MTSYSSDEEDVRPVHADALREKEAYTREMMDIIRETKRKEMEKRRQEREEKFQQMLDASANEVNNHTTKESEKTRAVFREGITTLQDQLKSEGEGLKEAIQQEGSKTETRLTSLQDQVTSEGLQTATKLKEIQQQGDKNANELKDVSKQLIYLTDLVEKSAKKKYRPFDQSDIDELDDESTVANMISLKSVLASESVHSPLSAGTNDDELCNQKKRSPSPLKEEETGPPMKKRIKSLIGGWKNTISGKKDS